MIKSNIESEKPTMKQTIIIIGTGAWGQALAHLCYKSNPNTPITLICREEKSAQTITLHPQLIQNNIQVHNKLSDVIAPESAVIIATPSTSLSEILEALNRLNHEGDILCTAKGFIDKPGIPYPHELYSSINPKTRSFAYLYGPTFADEVLNDLPTQAILASSSSRSKRLWQKHLNSDLFQTIGSTDLKGLAWCSVFKNIVAIVSGCMRACKLGKNAQAILITHATVELKSIIKKIKGNPQTAYSLAGLGDIILSASSDKSRNFKYGQNIANRTKITESTIEGKSNLKLISKKLDALQQRKPTLITLAENCIQTPKQCKALITEWIHRKTKKHQPET